ncbi:MAG: TetR/AcrR family transcriptional regulator [Spirochaetia bacterium]|jgi:AcrR family transcriptional regulator|nr:TetR/AcrR family transcriptional regulator [Spirochaetia bacterium]
MPQKGDRRKQQIIDAAKEMFLEKGYQSTHIGQVCEKLDIARGTVYQYFNNKKEILFTLVDAVAERVREVLNNDLLRDYLSQKPEKEDVINFMKKRISSSIEVILSEPIIIKLIFKDIPGIDSKIIKHVANTIEDIRSIMAEEITELKANNFFRDSLDPLITSSILLGGVMLIIYEYDKAGKDVLKIEVIDSIVKNYMNGVLNL